MIDARRKERKRLKREKKRNDFRRIRNGSPYQRFAQGDVVDCRINSDWRTRGQASGFVLRQGPDGKLGMAVFLIDLWCAGLKDIWGRLDIHRDEFDHVAESMNEQMDGTVRNCPLEELADVLAGGIRFARQNQFRLPPHYERWATLFGQIDPAHADMTYFGWEDDKLHWVGPLYDLQNRYLGRTEDFLARKDVVYTLGVDDAEWDDDEPNDSDEADEQDDEPTSESDMAVIYAVKTIRDLVEAWCRKRNVVPSRLIDMAVSLKLPELYVQMSGDQKNIEKIVQKSVELRESLSNEHRSELVHAEKQLEEFFRELRQPGRDIGGVIESKLLAETSPDPAL